MGFAQHCDDHNVAMTVCRSQVPAVDGHPFRLQTCALPTPHPPLLSRIGLTVKSRQYCRMMHPCLARLLRMCGPFLSRDDDREARFAVALTGSGTISGGADQVES